MSQMYEPGFRLLQQNDGMKMTAKRNTTQVHPENPAVRRKTGVYDFASALAYQYGLGKRQKFDGFRLVIIDEAFGRGSEESTDYGLTLFRELGPS